MIALAIALSIAAPYTIDGDTIVINNKHIRVLQVDTPELGECYGQAAKIFTQNFLKGTEQLTIKSDNKLNNTDKYGRKLRYVFKGNRNLSIELIKYGYAKPYFFNNMQGKYATLIKKYARQAQANRLGLWNCNERINNGI